MQMSVARDQPALPNLPMAPLNSKQIDELDAVFVKINFIISNQIKSKRN